MFNENDVSPFSLASFALFQARENDPEGNYGKWRDLLEEFDNLRSRIDPLADQNANLDLLLRSFEDHIVAYLERGGELSKETAGLQLHIHLSRLWVLGAYETLRTLHSSLKNHDNPHAKCLRSTDSKGCGEALCVVCSIGHLKNEAAIARTVIAKGEEAGDILNPPMTDEMKFELHSTPQIEAPDRNQYLVDGEAMRAGSICWYQHDKRIGRSRLFTRRGLSDRILSWNALGSKTASGG